MDKRKVKRSGKYPPYPGSNWDYGLKMAAASQLVKPNKVICVYCRQQAVTRDKLVHASDCPAKDEKD
jgi:hypothetical protein